MSKLVFVCYKNKKIRQDQLNIMRIAAEELQPDNLECEKPYLNSHDDTYLAIANRSDTILLKDNNVCAGFITDRTDSWHLPLTEPPDGTYALIRYSKDFIELLTDVGASRTIWYYNDGEKFIASTSQRCIIILLQSFHFNKKIVPWMLSSGTLGPDYSWDTRIKMVPPDSILKMNRRTFSYEVASKKFGFEHESKSYDEYKHELNFALNNVFSNIKLDVNKWVLPLSGGYDSRAILGYLIDRYKIRTVTWGDSKTQNRMYTDGTIAKQVSDYYGVENIYYKSDISNESFDEIFNRFLICGEGRVDHISGYMDGFALWQDLYSSGVKGIIRGDEGFGYGHAESIKNIKVAGNVCLLSDYENLDKNKLNFDVQQTLPQKLELENLTLSEWQDKLYHIFRAPYMLSALSDLKLPYVEVYSPFLSREIIYAARKLPDHLRTEKKLFKDIVNDLGPSIPYSRYDSVGDISETLRQETVENYILSEFNKIEEDSLTEEFLQYVKENIHSVNERKTIVQNKIKRIIKPFIPTSIMGHLRSDITIKIDFLHLAFRILILHKMKKMLDRDASLLTGSAQQISRTQETSQHQFIC